MRIGSGAIATHAGCPDTEGVGEHYYFDGGVRMKTPLSPALRLAADRVLVVA